MKLYELVCRHPSSPDVRWTCEFHAPDADAAIEGAQNLLRWAGCLFKTGRVVDPEPKRRHLAIVSISDEVGVQMLSTREPGEDRVDGNV